MADDASEDEDFMADALEDVHDLIARIEQAANAAVLRGQGAEAAELLNDLYALRQRVFERYQMREWNREQYAQWLEELDDETEASDE